MAKEIPLELLALFAKALKQTGEATLLELLLTSKAVFSMCEVKLLRELDIMAGKEGMQSWPHLTDREDRLRFVRKVTFRPPSFRSPAVSEEWMGFLDNLLFRCERINELDLDLTLGRAESGHLGFAPNALPKDLRRLSITASRAVDVEPTMGLLEKLMESCNLKFESWKYTGVLVDFARFPHSASTLTHLDLDLLSESRSNVTKTKIHNSGLQTAFSNLRTFAISASAAELKVILEMIESAPLLESWSLGKSADTMPDLTEFPKAISKLSSVWVPHQQGEANLFANPVFLPKILQLSILNLDAPILDWLRSASLEALELEIRGILSPDRCRYCQCAKKRWNVRW